MCAGGGDCGDELGVVGGGPGSSPGAGTDSGGGVCREAGVMQNSRRLEIATDALSFGETQGLRVIAIFRFRHSRLLYCRHRNIRSRWVETASDLMKGSACSTFLSRVQYTFPRVDSKLFCYS